MLIKYEEVKIRMAEEGLALDLTINLGDKK
jgi:hypothetical protein